MKRSKYKKQIWKLKKENERIKTMFSLLVIDFLNLKHKKEKSE